MRELVLGILQGNVSDNPFYHLLGRRNVRVGLVPLSVDRQNLDHSDFRRCCLVRCAYHQDVLRGIGTDRDHLVVAHYRFFAYRLVETHSARVPYIQPVFRSNNYLDIIPG